MISSARQKPEDLADGTAPLANDYIAPAPRVSVQAFCETEQTSTALQAAGLDRRLAKAHLSTKMGGMAAAIETYHSQPTPNVIILETRADGDILAGLDELATVCDPGTRVVVIGREQDDLPYRELVRRGVSDYVMGPLETLDAVRAICGLFSASDAVTTGRTIAVVGAKGGVGASTVAHNVAWTIARDLAAGFRRDRSRSRVRHRRSRLQPGPAAGHRQRDLSAGSTRLRADGTPAGQVLRSSQPSGRASDARAGLRFRGGSLRCDFRHVADDDALHRARHSASMVGMDPPRARSMPTISWSWRSRISPTCAIPRTS